MIDTPRYLAIGVLLASVLMAACTQNNPDALIQSAKGYLARNDAQAAIIQLKTVLQKRPESAEVRTLLGEALLEQGDPVSAEVELRKAVALKQPEASVVPPLARALSRLGQDKKLIQEFGATQLETPAAAADLKTSVAIAYARQGKRKELAAALDAALAAVPDYGPARRVQARLLAEERDFDGALQRLEKILAKSPDDHESWQFKGDLLYYAKGDAAAAQEAHRKALAIRPDYLPAHASQIAILLAQRDMAGAKTQLDELKKVKPNHLQTKYLEGEIALLNKDYKTAREAGQQVLKVAPDNLNALRLVGAVEYQAGSLLQAEYLLGRALQRQNHPATRKLLAQTYLRSGDMVRVLETLSPLLDGDAADAEALSLAAQAHLQIGDVAKAEAYFKQAATRNPGDVWIQTALAITQFSKGNVDSGYAQLHQLAASDGGTFADMALISAYVRQGKFDAALAAIDALEKKLPKQPIAAEWRGRVQLARQDVAGARKSFETALALDPLYFPAVSKLAGLDLADKKPDAAKARLDALLKADPKNVQVLLALAELKEKSGGSADDVATLLREAVRLNPTVAAPRQLLIDHYLKNKNMKAALAAASESVSAKPDSPELLDALGRVQQGSGELNQAIATFNRLAELRPRSPQPLLRLADAQMTMKNSEAARQSLRRALVVSPNLLAAQRGLLMIEMADGRMAEALSLARAIQRSPQREAIGSLFVGEIEEAQKNWPAAAAAYRTGLKTAPNGQLAIKLHAALLSGSQPTEADKFSASWIKEHPQDVSFVQYLGDRAIAQSNYALADTHYRSVIKVQPTNTVVLNNLAWLGSQLRKPDALGFAEKANSLTPNQPAFMDTLAMILARTEQVGKAIELEKRAVALQPQHAQFRMNLARMYVQAGDKDSAKSELEQLTKLGDKFPAHDEVGRMLKAL